MTVVFTSIDEVEKRIGEELEPGEWFEVTQERINIFADATDDWQWIHVDPEKAKESPYGTTIAHGYLTASLLPVLIRSVYRFEGAKMGVNYGSDGMRFPSPVPAGSRIRARAVIQGVERGAKGSQVIVKTTVEREGGDRPVLVATTRSLLVY